MISHMLHPSESYTGLCGLPVWKGCQSHCLVPYGSPETSCEECQSRYYAVQLGSLRMWKYEAELFALYLADVRREMLHNNDPDALDPDHVYGPGTIWVCCSCGTEFPGGRAAHA